MHAQGGAQIRKGVKTCKKQVCNFPNGTSMLFESISHVSEKWKLSKRGKQKMKDQRSLGEVPRRQREKGKRKVDLKEINKIKINGSGISKRFNAISRLSMHLRT